MKNPQVRFLILLVAVIFALVGLNKATSNPDKNVLTFTLVKDGVYPSSNPNYLCYVKVLEVVGTDSIVKNINVPEETYNLLTRNLVANQTGDQVIFRFVKNGEVVEEIKGKIWGSSH